MASPNVASTSKSYFHVLDPVEEASTVTEPEPTAHAMAEEEPTMHHARLEECDDPTRLVEEKLSQRAHAEACDDPTTMGSDSFTPSVIHDCNVALEKHVAANVSAVVLENAVSSVSSGLVRIWSDVAATTRVNWSMDATTLVDSHRDMLSDAQRNNSSADGMICSSQPNTAELLVSIEESVENSGDMWVPGLY